MGSIFSTEHILEDVKGAKYLLVTGRTLGEPERFIPLEIIEFLNVVRCKTYAESCRKRSNWFEYCWVLRS